MSLGKLTPTNKQFIQSSQPHLNNHLAKSLFGNVKGQDLLLKAQLVMLNSVSGNQVIPMF